MTARFWGAVLSAVSVAVILAGEGGAMFAAVLVAITKRLPVPFSVEPVVVAALVGLAALAALVVGVLVFRRVFRLETLRSGDI